VERNGEDRREVALAILQNACHRDSDVAGTDQYFEGIANQLPIPQVRLGSEVQDRQRSLLCSRYRTRPAGSSEIGRNCGSHTSASTTRASVSMPKPKKRRASWIRSAGRSPHGMRKRTWVLGDTHSPPTRSANNATRFTGEITLQHRFPTGSQPEKCALGGLRE